MIRFVPKLTIYHIIYLPGMPFYGRGWTLKSSGDTSVGASSTAPSKAGEFTDEAGMLAYYEVKRISSRW